MVARKRIAGIAAAVLLLAISEVHAVDQDEIKLAVEKGVAFLKHGQLEDGTWTYAHKTGASALIALTLLECDVDPADAFVQRAAGAIRKGCSDENQTYDISLAIMFLDRLGDKQDEPLIEALTGRLIKGQSTTGGWTYACPLAAAEAQRLRSQNDAPREATGGVQQGRVGRGTPPAQQTQPPAPAQAPFAGQQAWNPLSVNTTADNSNTQFATLALWIVRRHDLKANATLAAMEQRFRAMQAADGGWPYTDRSGTTPTMTCAGLIGLAVAYGTANQVGVQKESKPAKTGKESKAGPAKPRQPQDPNHDPAVRAGLIALGKLINGPFVQGERAWRQGPPPQFVQHPPGPQPIKPRFNDGAGAAGALDLDAANDKTDYYLLWSVERVAMAYGLKTIGKKDWYEWGAQIILDHRRPDNGWRGAYDAKVDTSFALLFLRRSNLVSDLTSSLRGKVNDPSEIKLQSGGGSGAELRNRQADGDSGSEAQLNLKKDGRKNKNAPPSADPEADRLATEVIKAPSNGQQGLIDDLRDNKGSVNTQALAAVIPHLTGPIHQKARDALVMRLTRMTAGTLQDKLQDDDVEIRRAAALAAAMKEEKKLIPDLIKLLDDDETAVVKAALAALKELAKQDFGPDANASQADRAKAITQWKDWWAKNK